MQKKMISCHTVSPAALLMVLLAFSCSTPIREVTYLYGIRPDSLYADAPTPDPYLIRPNDQLYIRVISDNPENVAFLNLIGSQTSTIGSSANIELITYLVDEAGNISYPFLGKISVGNKTLEEVEAAVQKEVDKYMQSAAVFVKLVTRTVTILGEVRSPGTFAMAKSRMTLFETIGMAGDITDYGNRKTVKLVRDMPEGQLVTQLDLTDPDIIRSPYFYVLPHDVLYVEHQTKVYGAKNMPYAAPLSITASFISIGLLILNLFRL
jgi:polysaccharide biosynthesis/export protein